MSNFRRLVGGRTRTRTLDPLIKSQLLYQLSYAPGSTGGSAAKPGCLSKGRWTLSSWRAPASRGNPKKKCRAGRPKKKPPGVGPGGWAAARGSRVGERVNEPQPTSRGPLNPGWDRRRGPGPMPGPRKREPRWWCQPPMPCRSDRGGASRGGRRRSDRPAAQARQHHEAVLLGVVRAVVERLGRVGELLEGGAAGLHRVSAPVEALHRVGRVLAASLRAANRSARCLARSRMALATTGQFFCCSGVSSRPAFSAACPSAKAAISCVLGRQPSARRPGIHPA